MAKKMISLLCIIALMVGLMPVIEWPSAKADTLVLEEGTPYQVGYARVDINPYVVDGDPSSGLMALPLAGVGDEWNRLSESELPDDNGDGVIDQNDGIKATCISVTDAEGNTILLITVDVLGSYVADRVRGAVLERVNAAIASGELTGLKELTDDQIYYAGTHTHTSVSLSSYQSGGKTGTNDEGVDLSVVNENLGIWLDRTVEDICDSAVMALEDRAAAELVKDQLSASQATSPVLQDKVMNGTRHYVTSIDDGESFVSGDNFNAVYQAYYADSSDYRTARGVDPQQVTEVDDSIYLLRFHFEDADKLPVVLTTWRAHPAMNNTDNYENSGRRKVSSDYVNAYRHALEYGCDVEFDPVNGYINSWTFGSEQLCRVAFFSDTGGNVNGGSYEQVTYSGSEGDVLQYGLDWSTQSGYSSANKSRATCYGVVLAQLARECIDDGLNEISVGYGTISTKSRVLYIAHKTVGVTEIAYKAALAYQEAIAVKTVTHPYKYTDPDTGEYFLIASKYHAQRLLSYWNAAAGAPEITPTKIVLRAFMLGDDVAFLSIPGEPFDFYYNDITLTGEARYASANNLWNELQDDAAYGRPYVLGYCNGAIGYFPNYDAYTYNQGSTRWAEGSYEAQISKLEQGGGESVVRAYDTMLDELLAGTDDCYVGPCAHCGEDQVWQPYMGDSSLDTGHYYLYCDVWGDQVKISGGQTVCIDLNGYGMWGSSRAIYTSDTTNKDVLNIMDLSEAQTGGIYGCGSKNGAAVGLYGGTMLIAATDEVNLYSGTIGQYDRFNYSTSCGGVVYIAGVMNMYGGKIEGGECASFTGSYISGGAVQTGSRTGNGGNLRVHGTLNLYGGEITGGSGKLITGTVDEDGNYTEVIEEQSGLGHCVYVTSAGTLNLRGDAKADHILLENGDKFTVIGNYSGSVELEFNQITELPDLTVVGNGQDADVSRAAITFTDAPGKTAAVKDDKLVVSDSPYTYGTCEHCGDCRWQLLTDGDLDELDKHGLTPGHYRLAEDVSTVQKQLNAYGTAAGTYCIDFAGHSFAGGTRAFYVYSDVTLNLMDSVGGAMIEGNASAAVNGGVIVAEKNATVNLYGGTYYHDPSRSETTSNGGVIYLYGAQLNQYGGTIIGGNVTKYGGAVMVNVRDGVYGSYTASGGQVTAGTADLGGGCIYVTEGCTVTLSGDPQIDEINFTATSSNRLTVTGSFTGTVALRYPDSLTLEDLTDLGNSVNGDVSNAAITLTDAPEKTLAVRGEDLVVSDSSDPYGICDHCGEVQWTLITDAQLDAMGSDGLTPGHYRMVEDSSTTQKSVKAVEGTSSLYCFDLAGHTFTGNYRTFLVKDGATLSIMDSVGTGILEGQSTEAFYGGVLHIATGATVDLYGGTLRHNTSKSETTTNGGIIYVVGGTLNQHGGTIIGGNVTNKAGAIMVTYTDGNYASYTATGGRVIAGTAPLGACVYVSSGCPVDLSGDAQIDEIYFTTLSTDQLTVSGAYSGSVALAYPEAYSLKAGTDIGDLLDGDISGATIALTDRTCKTVAADETNLIISDSHTYETVITVPTCTADGYTVYTCSACGDSYTGDTVAATGHSYENGACTLCGAADPDYVAAPTLTLSYPTLSFEDEILYNAYFTVSDAANIVEMGMITFDSRLSDGTIADAVEIIPGYTVSGSNYIVSSNGIPAKNMSDALYFKVYAKLSDGSYVYTDVAGYNAVAYANTILNNASTSAEAKALVVAMLNYGAAAQVQFDYKTDSLMNASLTAEQLALVDAYDESMVDAVVKADSSKVGLFVHNGGYTQLFPTVSFEGAFSINYYFTTAYTPDSAPTFYYWDAATYNSAAELTAENATGVLAMEQEDGMWLGTVSGIAAKEIDQTYYTAGVYTVGETTYYSPVVSYSLGSYCETLAAQDNAFGAATAVYGYYAKAYFAS